MNYATMFSGTESPISEGGAWTNLSSNRTLVNTASGLAFGTQIGGGFDDSYARLTQIWTPDVEIITTIFKGTTSGIQEVEHLHRLSDGGADPSKVFAYEINIARDGQYCDFVKWLGGTNNPGDFDYLVPTLTYSVPGGVNNGDRIKTTMVGNAINAYIDHGSGWVLINTGGPVVDTGTVYVTGRPAIGFFKTAGSGANNQFGWNDFQARTLGDPAPLAFGFWTT